jgi:hypothetical protein
VAADQRRNGGRRPDSVRVTAVIALAIGAAFLVWLIVRNRDSGDKVTPTTQTTQPTRTATGTVEPTAITAEALRALSKISGNPIYWAGPQPKTTYELTQASGKVFIRYLPRGVRVGDRHHPALTIGTYPIPDAFQAMTSIAKASGAVSITLPRGGLAVYNRGLPTNVYFAYPGSRYQVEVYTPNPRRARRLVRSGAVRPIS